MIEKLAKYDWDAIDDVYHSSTMHEIKVKADLHNVDLCDPKVLFLLLQLTTYHHAFWPHTAKRFTALKNLLRYDKSIEQGSRSKWLYSKSLAKYNDLKSIYDNDSLYKTPGNRQEIANWKQALNILEQLVKSRRSAK